MKIADGNVDGSTVLCELNLLFLLTLLYADNHHNKKDHIEKCPNQNYGFYYGHKEKGPSYYDGFLHIKWWAWNADLVEGKQPNDQQLYQQFQLMAIIKTILMTLAIFYFARIKTFIMIRALFIMTKLVTTIMILTVLIKTPQQKRPFSLCL